MMVRNGAGDTVKQKGRWLPNDLMSSLHADVVRARDSNHDDNDDDAESEWDSEWGEMPGGGGRTRAMPPWRMGRAVACITPGGGRLVTCTALAVISRCSGCHSRGASDVVVFTILAVIKLNVV
jgi:hypothetical protein